MTTLPTQVADPVRTAQRLNAILARIYEERGMPDSVVFDTTKQAIIARFADGPPYVHPFRL